MDTFANDIALLELNGNATINNFVYPICLPNGEQPNDDDPCYVTGYGPTGISEFLFRLCL